MSEQHEKHFRGWWVPKGIIELWEMDEINDKELLLLSVIDSLVDEDRRAGCFASNRYLAERIKLSPRRVQELLQRLEDIGLVRKRDRGGERHLFTAFSHVRRPHATDRRGRDESHGGDATNRMGGTRRIAWALAGNKIPSSLNKQEDNNPSARSARESVRGGFFGGDQTLTFAEQASKKLEEALRLARKFESTSKTKTWPKEIQSLIDSGHTKEEVKATLLWYIKNLDTPYTPQAHSTKAFRLKYAAIQSAMKRSAPVTSAKAEQLTPTVDEIALIADLETLGWRKGSKAQLSNAVILTHQRHLEWRKKVRAWVKWAKTQPMEDAEGWQNDLFRQMSFHETLDGLNRNSYDFTKAWWMKMHERLSTWDEWSGDLAAFTFHPEHKEFTKMGVARAEEGGWGIKVWEQYFKAINEN